MPAALFVHGAGGGAWEWNVWARVFAAEGFEVHALDLQPTAAGLAATRLADYSGQVRARIEVIRRQAVVGADMAATGLPVQTPVAVMPAPTNASLFVLIGASLGGLLALMNAEHADALVLINPVPPNPFNVQLAKQDAYPAIIPWRQNASLEDTQRALPDADESTQLFAFRRWRDESGAAMNEARAGIVVGKPHCPTLVIASECDTDISPELSKALAHWLAADFQISLKASHVGPLLGRGAPRCAERVVQCLNEFRSRS